MEGTQDTQIIFSQYAQDPLGFREDEEEEEVSELFKKVTSAKTKAKPNKPKPRLNKIVKRSARGHPPSFVINNEAAKGNRLVKIQIINISDSVPDQNDETGENVLLSAQYVASDGYDEIIDSTESVINKISKKLCGYSVSY